MGSREILETIREPMREWWLRALRWWMVPLVLWLGWSVWYEAWYFPHVSELNWPIQTQYWLTLVSDIIGLAFTPTALVLWSVAAWRANRLISDECVPASGDSNESTLLPARFIAGLWQGLWPLGIVLVGSIITGLASGLTYPVEDLGFPLWQFNLYQACTSPFDLLGIMLWQCAICAVLCHRPWLWWMWTVVFIVLGQLSNIYFSATKVMNMVPEMLSARISGLGLWEWLFGLMIMLTLVEALRSRRTWLKYPVYTLVLFTLLNAKLYLYNWWIWWERFNTLGIEISNGLAVLVAWQRVFTTQPFIACPGGVTNVVASPDWLLSISHTLHYIDGHPAWIIPVALLGNLLWITLLAALLYFHSLRSNREQAN